MICHFDVIPLLEPGNDEMLLKNAWNTLFFSNNMVRDEWESFDNKLEDSTAMKWRLVKLSNLTPPLPLCCSKRMIGPSQ